MADFLHFLGSPPLVWFWLPFVLFYLAMRFLARGKDVSFSDGGEVDAGVDAFWDAYDEACDDIWD